MAAGFEVLKVGVDSSVYSASELAAIEGWSAGRSGPPVSGVARLRRGTAGGALAAVVLLGLRDALEPEGDGGEAVVIELPGEAEDPSAPVVVRFVPGSPAATVAIVRSQPAG